MPEPARDYGRNASEGGRVAESEIRAMVETFYHRVRDDAVLGPIFEPRVGDAWSEHMDRMVDFWCTVLNGVPRFRGNPVAKHHAIPEIRSEHFDRWLELFESVLGEVFPEETAVDILGRARRMRMVLDRGPSPDADRNLTVLTTTRAER